MSSILNDETFNDTNKVKAMHSLVEIEKRNLKNILEQKSIIEAENLNRFDFIETIWGHNRKRKLLYGRN